jgi:hypothetical protein
MQVASPSYRLHSLSTLAKVGTVVGGYLAALAFSIGVAYLYIEATSGPERDAAGGMYAFGDSMVFLAALGIASLLPTGLALVFLRRNRIFWIGCCVLALAIASTSLGAAGVVHLGAQNPSLNTEFNLWQALSIPRIFVAPMVFASFGLAAVVAPAAEFRWCFLAAAAGEAMTSVYGFVHWFAPLYFPEYFN